jgi:hypothetical protein
LVSVTPLRSRRRCMSASAAGPPASATTWREAPRYGRLPAFAAKCTIDQLVARKPTVDANEFVRQHDAQRFGVLPGHQARILDLLELESDLPEIALFNPNARSRGGHREGVALTLS